MLVLPAASARDHSALRRFIAYAALARSTNANEAERCSRAAAGLAEQEDLCLHAFEAYPPTTGHITVDQDMFSLLLDQRIWWRGYLLLGIVEQVGSRANPLWTINNKMAPWTFTAREPRMLVLGKRAMVDCIRRMYVGASFLIALGASKIQAGDRRTAFALGAVLYFHDDLTKMIDAQRQKELRHALVVYGKELELPIATLDDEEEDPLPPAPPGEPKRSAVEREMLRLKDVAPADWAAGSRAGRGMAHGIENKVLRYSVRDMQSFMADFFR